MLLTDMRSIIFARRHTMQLVDFGFLFLNQRDDNQNENSFSDISLLGKRDGRGNDVDKHSDMHTETWTKHAGIQARKIDKQVDYNENNFFLSYC